MKYEIILFSMFISTWAQRGRQPLEDVNRSISNVSISSGPGRDFVTRGISHPDVLANVTEHSSSLFDTSTQESVAGRPVPCLKLTYNNTFNIYQRPLLSEHHLEIWFKPLSDEASIELKFDYSIHGEGDEEIIGSSSDFHTLLPLLWHKIKIVVGKDYTACRSWAELIISNINVKECLPHHTITRVQVSSMKNLVMWSTCGSPQGPWWDDMITNECAAHLETEANTKISFIVLSLFLAAALIGLVVSISYACYFRRSPTYKRSHDSSEGEYAYWDELNAQRPGISPPSTSTNASATGTINTFLSAR